MNMLEKNFLNYNLCSEQEKKNPKASNPSLTARQVREGHQTMRKISNTLIAVDIKLNSLGAIFIKIVSRDPKCETLNGNTRKGEMTRT